MEEMTRKRVLVTGATGFVGKAICQAIVAAGHEVAGLVREIPPEEKRLDGVEYRIGDVKDSSPKLAEAFAGITDTVHTVGIIAERPGRGDTFEAIHVEGTKNVLGAIGRSGGLSGRFVYISALGAAPNVRSEYSRTKARAESLVRDSELHYAILRPSVILGRGAEFLSQMEALVRRPPLSPFPLPFIPIPGSGKNRFQPVYVDEVAEVVVRCLEIVSEGDDETQTLELGGADTVTFDTLVKAIAAHTGFPNKRLLHLPMPAMFVAAATLEALLPTPPITTDQLYNLQRDNICPPDEMAARLGRPPLGLDAMLDRAYDARKNETPLES